MKTMKKILSGLAALLLISLFGFNQEVKAQVDDSIETFATLVQQIEVNGVTPLRFGNILNVEGEVKSVDVDGEVATGTDLGGTVNAGLFEISKGTGIPVVISFAASPLTLDGGTDELILSIANAAGAIFGRLQSDDVTNDVEFSPADGITIDGTTASDFFNETDLEVVVGGSITVPAGVENGLYQGTITLTAEYN